jgi:hypothetical protein
VLAINPYIQCDIYASLTFIGMALSKGTTNTASFAAALVTKKKNVL